jgi:hypothetical protein
LSLAVGTGSIREGEAGGQADLPVDRIFELSLVTGRRRNTNRSGFLLVKRNLTLAIVSPPSRYLLLRGVVV